jgi:RHS repeat-associated protein
LPAKYSHPAKNARYTELFSFPAVFVHDSSLFLNQTSFLFSMNAAPDTTAAAHSAPPVTNKVRAQYIYGVRDRNDLIFRDYSADGIAAPVRHYVLNDAMFSTTSIPDATGEIQPRLRYTAFGTVAYMNADFTDTHANPTAWQIFLHGEYYDIDTQWSNYGFRYYSSALGRWLKRDLLEEKAGLNLYLAFLNNSLNYFDFLGNMEVEECQKKADDIIASYGYGLNGYDDVVSELYSHDCPFKVECKCCDDPKEKDANGFVRTNENETVYLCANNLRNDSKFKTTLIHELIHVLQLCSDDDDVSCKKRLCMEIQAYANSGQFDENDPLFEYHVIMGAVSSALDACLKEMTPQEMVTLAKNHLYEKCRKPPAYADIA